MTDDFYTAFESVFRGPRSLVKDRMAIYVPLVRTLHRMELPGPALDLGCGRGEWLELLKEQNIPATGVDQDDRMLDEARKTAQTIVRAEAWHTCRTSRMNHWDWCPRFTWWSILRLNRSKPW